jgi:hypothetical protein
MSSREPKGHGLDKTHTVRNIETGVEEQITQKQWMDRVAYPRDKFERVDADEGGEIEGGEGETGGEGEGEVGER